MSADYQNGNTKKAFTLGVTRRVQLATCDDLTALTRYMNERYMFAPMEIEDRETDKIVRRLGRR
jgi:hypothetical protein